MPSVTFGQAEIAHFGEIWRSNGGNLNKKQSMDFGLIFDNAVGRSLAAMLGGIPIVRPSRTALMASYTDCVEKFSVFVVLM